MDIIRPIVEEHQKKMVQGQPALNYCDDALMVSILLLLP